MTRNDNNPIAPAEHVTDMLTAYIDGTLEPAERGTVRAHLEGCDACRAEYAELMATRSVLRSVPAVQAPRSFTLTPEMARKVRPPSLFERIFNPVNAPRMAMGSVLSFVLLFFVVVVPLFNRPNTTFSMIGSGLGTAGDSSAYESAPSSKQQDEGSRTMGAPAQSNVAEPTPSAAPAQAFSSLPQGTPAPPTQALPPNSGGGIAGPEPTVAAAIPAAVPTQPAGAGTTAGSAPTAVAGTPKDALTQEQPRQSFEQAPQVPQARQAAPYSPPVDWGAALSSIAPLFLLALGLALAVMSWIARRNEPM